MAALDRFVRRANKRLRPDEGLLASVLGREADGRRRVALVATDQRILLVTARPEPQDEVGYDDLTVEMADRGEGAVITLRSPTGERRVEHIADVSGARLFVDLVRRRADVAPAPTDRKVTTVRLVS